MKVTPDLTMGSLPKFIWLFLSFLRLKAAQRSKRGFKFHEKGKFQQIAQRIRAKV